MELTASLGIMELAASLEREVLNYNKAAYAPTPRRAYATYMRVYFNFCKVWAKPAPASTATYLACWLKITSVKQYLNVVWLIHLELGLPNLVEKNFHLSLTLWGIKSNHPKEASHNSILAPPIRSRA